MRRALVQPKFAQLELAGGRIWGALSRQSSYDPHELYERGMAPHLAFANANDVLQWHKEYGPLFGFTSAYTCSVQAFAEARQRFTAVLNLWQACRGDRKDLRQCFLTAMSETGCVCLPGQDVIDLNQGWLAEAKGEEFFWPSDSLGSDSTSLDRVTMDAERSYICGKNFAHKASREKLREAAEELLKVVLSLRLQDVHPDFRDERGFRATWTMRDFLQACYLMLFYDVVGRKAIRSCKECNQFFYPTTKRPRFCSADCARKNRQRRYWNRQGKILRRKRLAIRQLPSRRDEESPSEEKDHDL